LTRQPWWDEGVLIDPAINFRNFGHLGSTILDPQGFHNWPGVHQYTFWQFPFWLMALGAWFRVVPATVVWARVFSLVWGCIYVICWYVIARRLTRNENIALLIASVIALDYSVIAAASDARMEMMCVALGQLGVAYFLCNRERNWTRAVFGAACFGAGSLFCHPLGAVCNLFIAATVLQNWREIRGRALVLAALPYVAGLALYGAYAAQTPVTFFGQIQGSYGYRMHSSHNLLSGIFREVYVRYWQQYYGWFTGWYRLKGASLLFAAVGTVLLVAFNRRWRREPLGRLLITWACISYVGVALLDNQGQPVYLVYSMPIFSACAALWVYSQWEKGGIGRPVSCILLAGALLASIGGFGFKILQNDYKRLYLPAVEAVRRNLPAGGLVMGGSELAFALGFDSNLIDDRYMGYSSGKVPDVYVFNDYYGGGGPGWDFAQQLLRTRYHLVFQNSAYSVYARNQVVTARTTRSAP
jgi:hypothetical protein